MCTSFLIICYIDIPSYTDYNTAYVVKDDWFMIESLAIESLEHAAIELFQWFFNNQMKINPDKCHSKTNKCEDIVINVGKYPIKIANVKNYSVWKYVIN